MRICPRCKNRLSADAIECDGCGWIFLEVVAQEIEKSIEKRARGSIGRPAPRPVLQPYALKKCRNCGHILKEGVLKCANCGIISYTSAAPVILPTPVPAKRKTKVNAKWYKTAGTLVICLLILATQNLNSVKNFFGVTKEEWKYPEFIPESPTASARFDVSVDLLDRGSGLSWNEHEFILGKQDQQGFLRLIQNGEQYAIRSEQNAGIRPLTYNGTEFIGFRESSFFNSFKRYYFTVHDGDTLRVVREYSAPEMIGGLAWDGIGYWAATRKEEKNERGIIYRLDKNFVIKNKMAAPSISCAGLAWDKSNLWFLDDRGLRLHVLNVKGVQAFALASYDLPLKSVSGIAFDGKRIWISDDHRRRLVRMRPGFGNSRASKW